MAIILAVPLVREELRPADRINDTDGDQAPSPSPSVPRLKPRAYLRGFSILTAGECRCGGLTRSSWNPELVRKLIQHGPFAFGCRRNEYRRPDSLLLRDDLHRRRPGIGHLRRPSAGQATA
jgi:hypothetical protein